MADGSDRREVARIEPLVDTNGNSFEELVNRLDDGNGYPGMYLELNDDGSYTLYEEGYE